MIKEKKKNDKRKELSDKFKLIILDSQSSWE